MSRHCVVPSLVFLSPLCLVLSDLIAIDSYDEEQRRVSSIDAFVISILEERALRLVARQALADDFTFQRTLLGDRQPLVVLSQTSLTLLVHLRGSEQSTAEGRRQRSRSRTDLLLSAVALAARLCADHENEFDRHGGGQEERRGEAGLGRDC